MFNIFDEIKNKLGKCDSNFYTDFTVVNMSGRLLYIEGHRGLIVLRDDMVSVRIKDKKFVIEGKNMILKELTENTILLEGIVLKTEFMP